MKGHLPSDPSILERLKPVDLSQWKRYRNHRHLRRQRRNPIKVPLGTSIADVLKSENENNESSIPRNYPSRRAYTMSGTTANAENNEDDRKRMRWRRNKTLRQFEIEALLEGENASFNQDGETHEAIGGNDKSNISKLLVQEVESMAITSETTYKFSHHWARHDNNHSNINEKNIYRHLVENLSILVSSNNHDGEEGRGSGLTILSINQSTGQVRGLHRDHASSALGMILQITNDGTYDDGSRKNFLRARRSLSKELHKNWKCEALHPHENEDDNSRENHDAFLFSNRDGLEEHDVQEFIDVHSKTIWEENNSEQHSSKRSVDLNSPCECLVLCVSAFIFEKLVESGKRKDDQHVSFHSHTFLFTHKFCMCTAVWIEPKSYSFHVDIIIEIDKYFIEKQGGDMEEVIEYINFLVSAANVIFEHEVDAHCKLKNLLMCVIQIGFALLCPS